MKHKFGCLNGQADSARPHSARFSQIQRKILPDSARRGMSHSSANKYVFESGLNWSAGPTVSLAEVL